MRHLTIPALALVLVVLGTAAAAETIPPKTHPDSKDWDQLVADDLSNAQFPAGVWSYKDGILTATEDQCIWTKKDYDDFIVDLEFKTAEGTNSGVIVYCSDMENWIPNSVEIQIADDFAEQWANSPKTWQCGAIFGRLAASESVVKKPGQWNRMTVTCRGPHDLGSAERKTGYRDRYAQMDLSHQKSRRQRNPGLAQQTTLGVGHSWSHWTAGKARRCSDLLPQYENQDACRRREVACWSLVIGHWSLGCRLQVYQARQRG